MKYHKDVFFIKCVTHIQNYCGCTANFFLENRGKKKREKNAKVVVFKQK